MDGRGRALALAGFALAALVLVVVALSANTNFGALTGVFADPLSTSPTQTTPAPTTRGSAGAPRGRPVARTPARGASPAHPPPPAVTPGAGGLLTIAHALEFAAASSIVLVFALLAFAMLLVKNRLDARERREYALYRVDLSMHDTASPRALKDLAEALTNLIRKRQLERAIGGQPFFAIEFHYEQSDLSGGMEWYAAIRCEPRMADAVQSLFAGAYPDVRLGWVQGRRGPQPLTSTAAAREPSCVVRYRKARSFVLPLTAREEDEAATPAMEAIALTQVSVGVQSVVRLQVTPTDQHFEGWARRRFRAHENQLARSERGLSERRSGVRSSVNTSEMTDSVLHTQNAGLLWFEVQVAADTAATADQVASALTGRRGENRLYRRRMLLRQGLYQRRFATATPPLLPTFGWRRFNTLLSSTELAPWLALPGARMKAVPVRRLTIPRLPPPPDAPRAPEWSPRVPDDDILTGVIV